MSFAAKGSMKAGAVLLALLFVTAVAANVRPVSAYSPQAGDSYNYSETITVNNGQGSYAGYTDQTQVTGTEQVKSVSGSTVTSSFSYSSGFSSNQGTSSSNSTSGAFTWSSTGFTYINGTDDQSGYSMPTYVWFAMNPSLAVGDTFTVLNTQFTVLSKGYSFQLPTEANRYVQTIEAKGTGQYQRDDSYGIFAATFTWYEYFDPTTGYIVGYSYIEQDNGQYQGQPGSFTYTDNLYVTQTSYALSGASAPSTGILAGLGSYFIYVAVVVVVLVIIVAIYAASRNRRRSLPKHPYTPQEGPPPPAPTPWESKIDLGSKPPEQVVIRDVAKVNCKYCGTLIPTTADRCPYCGAPRQ